jgi:hypothetical protein
VEAETDSTTGQICASTRGSAEGLLHVAGDVGPDAAGVLTASLRTLCRDLCGVSLVALSRLLARDDGLDLLSDGGQVRLGKVTDQLRRGRGAVLSRHEILGRLGHAGPGGGGRRKDQTGQRHCSRVLHGDGLG